MKTLIVLVGNIGAGKSTTCQQYVDDSYVIVSRDALRYMIGNGTYTFNPLIEAYIASSTLHIVEEFLKV